MFLSLAATSPSACWRRSLTSARATTTSTTALPCRSLWWPHMCAFISRASTTRGAPTCPSAIVITLWTRSPSVAGQSPPFSHKPADPINHPPSLISPFQYFIATLCISIWHTCGECALIGVAHEIWWQDNSSVGRVACFRSNTEVWGMHTCEKPRKRFSQF